MRYYVRRSQRAGLMLFKRGNDADFKKVDEIRAHNLRIAESAFDAIQSGTADYASIRDGLRQVLYTRSTRGDFIQATHFAMICGEWEPTSHTDIHNAKEFEDRLFKGCYLNVGRI